MIKHKNILFSLLAGGAALVMLLAGCDGALSSSRLSTTAGEAVNAPTTGLLEVRVTDAPPKDEVTSIKVTVESVEIHQAGAAATATGTTTATTSTGTTTATGTETETEAADEAGNWLSLEMSGTSTFDLLQIKGLEEVLATGELEAGKYTQIRMEVTKVEVSLGDGTPQEATLPGGKLKFVHPFNVIAGESTVLLFDFDAAKSVNITGQGEIMFKPVIKLTTTKDPAAPTALGITTASLPGGVQGTAYSAFVVASGGTAPQSWTGTAGSLPAGLVLDAATGAISGTPTVSGDFSFTLQVTDSSSPAQSDTQALVLHIDPESAV